MPISDGESRFRKTGLEFPISEDSYFSDIWGTKLLITTIEGVSVEDATWNDKENRIDFKVLVNRRGVTSKTNPEHVAGTYYNYDETMLRSYIEKNWFNMFWGLSHIIHYNNIQVAFNVEYQE